MVQTTGGCLLSTVYGTNNWRVSTVYCLWYKPGGCLLSTVYCLWYKLGFRALRACFILTCSSYFQKLFTWTFFNAIFFLIQTGLDVFTFWGYTQTEKPNINMDVYVMYRLSNKRFQRKDSVYTTVKSKQTFYFAVNRINWLNI